jgi:hypothetical protein
MCEQATSPKYRLGSTEDQAAFHFQGALCFFPSCYVLVDSLDRFHLPSAHDLHNTLEAIDSQQRGIQVVLEHLLMFEAVDVDAE